MEFGHKIVAKFSSRQQNSFRRNFAEASPHLSFRSGFCWIPPLFIYQFSARMFSTTVENCKIIIYSILMLLVTLIYWHLHMSQRQFAFLKFGPFSLLGTRTFAFMYDYPNKWPSANDITRKLRNLALGEGVLCIENEAWFSFPLHNTFQRRRSVKLRFVRKQL